MPNWHRGQLSRQGSWRITCADRRFWPPTILSRNSRQWEILRTNIGNCGCQLVGCSQGGMRNLSPLRQSYQSIHCQCTNLLPPSANLLTTHRHSPCLISSHLTATIDNDNSAMFGSSHVSRASLRPPALHRRPANSRSENLENRHCHSLQ